MRNMVKKNHFKKRNTGVMFKKMRKTLKKTK